MLAVKLIIEGLGLGFLLYLICAIGIRNGAVGMVFLYDQKVQDRVVELGLTTREDIRKRGVRFRSLCLPGYLIYVLVCVYFINGARGFWAGFWQGFVSTARCNLHLDTLRGRSDHHKMEGLFKAAARAIREAVEIDIRRNGTIPSTKGIIC